MDLNSGGGTTIKRILAVLLLFTPIARAQMALYGNFSYVLFPQVMNGGTTAEGTPSNLYNNFNILPYRQIGRWNRGVGAGLTLYLPTHSNTIFGFDLRGSYDPGSKANGTQPIGGDTILAGLKVGYKSATARARPYFVVDGGHAGAYGFDGYIGNSNQSPQRIVSSSYGVFGIFGGLDVNIYRGIDLRAIEIGSVYGPGHFDGYTGNAIIHLWSLSSGAVVNFSYPKLRHRQ